MARFIGTDANERYLGTDGTDRIKGKLGDDRLFGAAGDDRIRGNRLDDTVIGGIGADTLSGNTGRDILRGNGGDDICEGGDGDDTLFGGTGSDILDGGTGDDVFVLRGRGGTREPSVSIEDSAGRDTLDFSLSRGPVVMDLQLGGTFNNRSLRFSGSGDGSLLSPIDLVFAQDLSGSYADDIATARGLIDDVAAGVLALQPEARFGVTSFIDKPIGPFGASGEWAYRTDLALTGDVAALISTYNGLATRFGADEPESQMEALLQIALRFREIGFVDTTTKVVVLFTDATAHQQGDFGTRPPNDGDDVLDGNPPSTGEDYPSLAQVRNALLLADITPIFAVTANVQGYYQRIVEDWGFGATVPLSGNSANLVGAIESALEFATTAVIEDAIGSAFDDTLQGNATDNALTGGGGADRFVFEDETPGARVFFGLDTITDFSVQEGDRIEIRGGLVFTQSEAGGSTILTFANTIGEDSTITVLGATGLVVGVDILV